MNALLRGSHRSTAVLLAILLIAPTLGGAALPLPVAAQRMPDADPQAIDWDVVAQAMGKSGQMMSGDVYRIAMPRTDLNVVVEGVPIKAGFALGSYAAFRQMGDQAIVMGDLVLLDEEVPAVMSGLFENGLQVTALHNHLNQVSPHVMYLHYSGMGEAVQVARGLHQALSASGTPLDMSPAAAPPATSELDTGRLDTILGRAGRLQGGGVFQYGIPRSETLTEGDMELLPAMGVATVINFQPTDGGKAAITGDFVLTANEVNPVAGMLRANGVEVTALHNHALADQPRLFYMHFWANDDPVRLAQALRAALDLTNSVPGS
jgi:hypothetical protein